MGVLRESAPVIDTYLGLSILIWGYRYLFGVIDTYLGLSILIWGYRILFGTFWAFGAPLYAPTHKDSIDLSALVAQVLLWALGNLIGIPYCPGFFFCCCC